MSATLGRLGDERPWISSETLGAAARAVASLREWSVALPIPSKPCQCCVCVCEIMVMLARVYGRVSG